MWLSFSLNSMLPGKFCPLFCCLLIFFKIYFFDKFFQEYRQLVKQFGSDDQDQHFVRPDFGPICLPRLTLNSPIATKVVCFSRLLKCLRSLYGKQCGPRSDCSYRSSLFWVHTVCFYTYGKCSKSSNTKK